MWVPLDGFKTQSAGAVCVIHAVALLQMGPFLGGTAAVEGAEELGEVVLHVWTQDLTCRKDA